MFVSFVSSLFFRFLRVFFHSLLVLLRFHWRFRKCCKTSGFHQETDALMYWNDKKKTQVLAKFGSKFNYQSHFLPQCHHSLHTMVMKLSIVKRMRMNMREFAFRICVYNVYMHSPNTENIHSQN